MENNTKPFYNTTIPSDWEIIRLGSIGEFKNGINKDKKDFGHGFPFVGLMDIFDTPKVYNKDFSLVNSTKNERRDFDLQKGDVLFVRSSVKPIGVGLTSLICHDMKDTTFSGFLIRFRIKGKLDFEFKSHCFFESNFRSRLLTKSTISANTNINQVALKSLEIAVPPLSEQHVIANVLSLMDTAINKNNQLIIQKELGKKWLMQNLLTGKKRLEGFSGEWKDKKLKDILNQAGIPLIPEEHKLYQQIGIRSHTKGIFHKEKVTGATLGNKRVFWIEPDCFVLNIVFAWEHAIAKTTENETGMIASHRFPMYSPNEEILDLDYLLSFFMSKRGKHLLGLASPGGAGRNKTLGKSEFMKLQIPVPTLKEQTAIAQTLQTADKEIQLLKTKTEKLREQKKGMMQALLTGKKRLKIN